MRGSDAVAGSLFSHVDLEARVRSDHPLRAIRGIVNTTLAELSLEFDALYSPITHDRWTLSHIKKRHEICFLGS
jgi:hypothetical protein